jgi:ssDNA-binding Zn-finger/Zn-ribbon topoisomerase 1
MQKSKTFRPTYGWFHGCLLYPVSEKVIICSKTKDIIIIERNDMFVVAKK